MQFAPPINRVNVMFRAFSDRTRLRILNLLKGGELCVCDLVRVIDAPQPTISRHLAYLRKAKLVKSPGTDCGCTTRLPGPHNDFHRKLLECLSCCFGDVPELARDARRLRKSCRPNGRCCE